MALHAFAERLDVAGEFMAADQRHDVGPLLEHARNVGAAHAAHRHLDQRVAGPHLRLGFVFQTNVARLVHHGSAHGGGMAGVHGMCGRWMKADSLPARQGERKTGRKTGRLYSKTAGRCSANRPVRLNSPTLALVTALVPASTKAGTFLPALTPRAVSPVMSPRWRGWSGAVATYGSPPAMLARASERPSTPATNTSFLPASASTLSAPMAMSSLCAETTFTSGWACSRSCMAVTALARVFSA